MLASRPKEDLQKIASDLYRNLIFSSVQLLDNQHLLPSIFIPIALGGFSKLSEAEVLDIGMVYEYYSKSSGREVNGYPIFFSCSLLNKADTSYILDYIKRFKDLEAKASQE